MNNLEQQKYTFFFYMKECLYRHPSSSFYIIIILRADNYCVKEMLLQTPSKMLGLDT